MFGLMNQADFDGLQRSVKDTCSKIERLESVSRPDFDVSEMETRHRLDLEELAVRISGIEVRVGEWTDTLDSIEGKLRTMTHAISEGIERTDRAERRIKATVRRARKELSEAGLTDPGVDAENLELRLLDGEGGDGGKLPPLRENMEPPENGASSVRGVTLEQLQRARGF